MKSHLRLLDLTTSDENFLNFIKTTDHPESPQEDYRDFLYEPSESDLETEPETEPETEADLESEGFEDTFLDSDDF